MPYSALPFLPLSAMVPQLYDLRARDVADDHHRLGSPSHIVNYRRRQQIFHIAALGQKWTDGFAAKFPKGREKYFPAFESWTERMIACLFDNQLGFERPPDILQPLAQTFGANPYHPFPSRNFEPAVSFVNCFGIAQEVDCKNHLGKLPEYLKATMKTHRFWDIVGEIRSFVDHHDRGTFCNMFIVMTCKGGRHRSVAAGFLILRLLRFWGLKTSPDVVLLSRRFIGREYCGHPNHFCEECGALEVANLVEVDRYLLRHFMGS